MTGRSAEVTQWTKALREAVYHALIDPTALAVWLPPDGMTGAVHQYDPRPGGRFRLSLTYDDPSGEVRGKSSVGTDTVEGRFAEIRPFEAVVWVTTFDSPDPAFAGEMSITWSLADANGGTAITVLCEGIPEGIRLEDNETGSAHSLRKLSAFVEGGVGNHA
ncbi:MAG: SRPBCC domain-containing protein [Anaerolineae bacterium]